MAAIAARIGFIMSSFRRAIATTQAVKDRHGSLARETADPVETFFDSVDDAQSIANERQDLLSPERRRFKVTAKAVDEVANLDLIGGIPIVHYTDRERGADRTMLMSEVIIDLGRQTVTTTLWG